LFGPDTKDALPFVFEDCWVYLKGLWVPFQMLLGPIRKLRGSAADLFERRSALTTLKASGLCSKGFFASFSFLLLFGLVGPRSCLKDALRLLFEGCWVYSKGFWVPVRTLLGFDGRAVGLSFASFWIVLLLGPFGPDIFVKTLRLFCSKALGSFEKLLACIRKASGFYSKDFRVLLLFGPFGLDFLKQAPAFLFEGFWVYSEGFWVPFQMLLGFDGRVSGL